MNRIFVFISLIFFIFLSCVYKAGASGINVVTPTECMYYDSSKITCACAIVGGVLIGVPFAIIGGVIDCIQYPITRQFGLFTYAGMSTGSLIGQTLTGGIPYAIEQAFKPNPHGEPVEE